MKNLWGYLRAYRKQAIIGPVFKLIEAIFELIVPLLMAKIIDVGVENRDVGYVLRMGGVILLLGVVGLCCAAVCQYCGSVASQGFGTQLRNGLFAHINTFSHGELDRFGTPSLITRLTSDVNQLQVAVAMLIRLVVRAPFLVVGALIMAMLIDAQLSMIFLIAMPLIVLVLYLIMNGSVPFYRLIQKHLDRISRISRETLEGARVIRAFSKQESEQQRFEEAGEDVSKTTIRVGRLMALLNPLTYIIMNFGIIAILWFGGMRVNTGSLTQGEIIALINYITQILLALIVLANLVVLFTKAYASAQRVSEVLAVQPSVAEQREGWVKPVCCDVPVRFEHVYFSYGEYDGSEKYALSDLTFSVAKGETLGIIGGTGSGKSTLVNLIPRFYDVQQGRVLVNGEDVRDVSFSQLREPIGIVPQKAVLFTGTVEENIRWGCENADDAQVDWALRVAQAQEFVKRLENGKQTMISQGGKNVSGGQKQRLTIARALVSKPEILILDDSASALDFATDAALRRALHKETAGMTVILVSQRVSSIKNADQILVLDDGKMAGLGTHEQLLQTCEVYREICSSQLSAKEER